MAELSISLDPSSGKDLKQYTAFVDGVADVSIHLDVMDGEFCTRKSITAEEYNYVVKNVEKKIDVHLMINEPHNRINPYISKTLWGTIRSVSFHPETVDTEACLALIKKIKVMGVEAGVVINLDQDIEDYGAVIWNADVVTIMTVQAGASGQSFNAAALEKIKYLRENYPAKRIIVDGGISADNIQSVRAAGANTVVVGNAIYAAPDRNEMIAQLK